MKILYNLFVRKTTKIDACSRKYNDIVARPRIESDLESGGILKHTYRDITSLLVTLDSDGASAQLECSALSCFL